MIVKFLFAGYPVFVIVEDINLYQKLVLKSDVIELNDYSTHECIYILMQYLNKYLPDLSIIDCLISKEALGQENLIGRDLIIEHMKYGTIYFPPQIEEIVSYRLGLEPYLSLVKFNELDIEEPGQNKISEVTQIRFNLVHGVAKLSPAEILKLKPGDVILFDDEFAPNLLAIDLGSIWLKFKLINQQAVFCDEHDIKLS